MSFDQLSILGTDVSIAGSGAGLVQAPDTYDLGASGIGANQLAVHVRCTEALVKSGTHVNLNVASWIIVGSATLGGTPIVIGQGHPIGNPLLDARAMPAVGEEFIIPLACPVRMNRAVYGIRYISAVWANLVVATQAALGITATDYFTAGKFTLRLVGAKHWSTGDGMTPASS